LSELRRESIFVKNLFLMKPFRITGIEAHQIGPFGELKMTFPEKPAGMEDKAEIHILTGENGVGKTTVLEMLIGGFGFNNLQRKRRYSANINSYSVFFSEGIESNFSWGDAPNSWKTSISNHQIQKLHQIIANPNLEATYAGFTYSGSRSIGAGSISSIKELTDKPLQDALNFLSATQPNLVLQWIANNIAKEAIAKNQDDEEKASKFRGSVSRLESAIEVIVGHKINFIFKYDPMSVIIEVDGESLEFNLLPDGLKSIISWLADLLMRMDRVKWVNNTPVFERNFILFLDEIEVHMHPKWQRKILPAVQGLFPNAQIFISTHSPFVVGSVDGAWVHRLVKPNGDSVPDGEPFLSEDGKSVLHVLEEVFGVTEQFGPNVERDLKQFYNLRDEVLKGKNGEHVEALVQSGRALAEQSTELHHIIEMEIRQVNHRKKLNLSL